MATPSYDRIRLLPAAQPPPARWRSVLRDRRRPARSIGPLIASAPAIWLLRANMSDLAGSPRVLVFSPTTVSKAIALLRRAGRWRAEAGGDAPIRRVGGR